MAYILNILKDKNGGIFLEMMMENKQWYYHCGFSLASSAYNVTRFKLYTPMDSTMVSSCSYVY